jgi:hypothetical protein
VIGELPDIAAAAQRIIGGYMHREGFEKVRGDRTQVEFSKVGVLLRLSYYAEDAPPRGLNIGLGVQHDDGSTETLGLWALIPEGDEAIRYSLWKFTSDSELDETLVRVRDEVLQPFAASYWRDPSRLTLAVGQGVTRLEQRHETTLNSRCLENARRAFAAGEFQTAVDNYILADGDLTEVDAKRLKIARREVGADS